MSSIDVLYLARNRLAYTQASFGYLLANTDWSLVDRLVVYDDGSEDGTREWLEERMAGCPHPYILRETHFGSPVAVMADYLATAQADIMAKVDNDIAVPPGWLSTAARCMEENPELELLGLAAGWAREKQGPLGYQVATHIGGVGLMRRSAFDKRPPLEPNGRQGFTTWQHKHEPIRGWLTPDVLAVQLDLIPESPWRELAASYVAKGWAREWPPMEDRSLWSWITD